MQLVLLPLAILAAWQLFRAAGPVLLLFTIAALAALLLNPVVALLQRARLPRGLAVLVTMLSVICVLTGIGFLVANPIADQVSTFQTSVPGIVDDATNTLADFQTWLDDNGIDVQVSAEGQTALQTLGENVSAGSGELVSFTRDAVRVLVEASFALILVIVICVYMLLYGERIGTGVRSVMPRGDGTPGDDFPTRIQSAVLGYVRGQGLFSLIMGASAGVLLWVLGTVGVFPEGRTYALFFGAWYGFAELIPYVGPAIGGFPPVIIAAFSGEPLDAVWLIIAFTALQQLEGHVVAPNIFGQALRINPLLVIFALLLGGQVYGLIGAFIALPIAAIVRESVVYFRRHLVFQAWDFPGVTSPNTGAAGVVGAATRVAPRGAGGGGVAGETQLTEPQPDPQAPERTATEPQPDPQAPERTATEPQPDPQPPEPTSPAPTRHCPECETPLALDATACPACGTDLGGSDGETAASAAAPS
jgi:predicted PurR-regulated permease PerM